MKTLYYTSLGVVSLLFVGTLILAGDKCGEQILIATGSLVVSTICVCVREASKERKNAALRYRRKTDTGDSAGKN
ncbi:MAG: hypothetical protein FWH52_07710 [Synergistaceae bacterium]|nr:hypothetical protein [Synergistaceae bacterium]